MPSASGSRGSSKKILKTKVRKRVAKKAAKKQVSSASSLQSLAASSAVSDATLNSQEGGGRRSRMSESSVSVDMPELLARPDTELKFNLGHFMKEFIYNLFGWIIIPIVVLLDGTKGVQTRGFVALNPFTIMVNFFYALLYLADVLYFYYRPVDISIYEILVGNTMLLLRSLVIATKYAFVSEEDYYELSHPTAETEKKQFARQFLTGWVKLSGGLIVQELQSAASRREINVNQAMFKAEYDEEHINQVFGMAKASIGDLPPVRGEGKRESGIQNISARTLAVQCVLDGQYRGRVFKPIFFLTFLHASIPFLGRWGAGQYVVGHTWPATVITFCIAFFIGFNFFTNAGFLACAVLDYYRRRNVSAKLNSMVSTGYFPEELLVRQRKERDEARRAGVEVELGTTPSFQLDLSYPQNIINWYLVRHALQDFGLNYYKRIQLFSGYFALFVLTLFGFIAYNLFVGDPSIDLTGLFYVILYGCSFSPLLFMTVNFGAEINELALTHVQSLLKQRLMLRNRLYVLANDRLVHCEQLIDTVIKSIEVDLEARPMTFLGVRAGSTLARGILTAFGSILAAALRLVAANGGKIISISQS